MQVEARAKERQLEQQLEELAADASSCAAQAQAENLQLKQQLEAAIAAARQPLADEAAGQQGDTQVRLYAPNWAHVLSGSGAMLEGGLC
jgi:hypothetical protein